MDTMANFLGRLGAFAPAVLEMADCGCGLAGSEAQIDATVAMQKVLQRYAALSAQGEKLRQILTTGATVPCAVWAAYNQACLDYMTKSQAVFDQLAQRGVVVDQIVYSGGKPVPDASNPGQYKTLRISSPLRPPSFTFVGSQCPGIATFQGATAGWVPVPIELGAISEATLGVLGAGAAFVLTAGGALVGASGLGIATSLSKLAVWISEYADAPGQIINAYTACFDSQVKAGATPTAANQKCSDVQAAAQKFAAEQAARREGGWGFWTWVAVGGVVLVAGGALALYLRKRALGLINPLKGASYRPRRLSRQRSRAMLLGKLYLEP